MKRYLIRAGPGRKIFYACDDACEAKFRALAKLGGLSTHIIYPPCAPETAALHHAERSRRTRSCAACHNDTLSTHPHALPPASPQ